NRLRKQKQREREKQLLITNDDMSRDSHVTSQQCHATDIEVDNDKDKEREEEKNREQRIPYKKIIDYLNLKTNKHFKNTEKSKALIKSRFNEGQTYDDFLKVIDTKTKQWLNDPKLEKYLRPATLFGNKFDDYLNEYQPLSGKKNRAKHLDDYNDINWEEIYGS